MKKAFKIITLALVICLFSVVFSGCGGSTEIKRPGTPTATVNVSATRAIEKTTTGVKVSATTDIMDGTLCHLSISGVDGKVISKQTLTVQNGAVSCEFTANEKWPQKIIGYFVCTAKEDGDQSEAVLNLYGQKFENMQGKDVLWDADSVSLVSCSEAIIVK